MARVGAREGRIHWMVLLALSWLGFAAAWTLEVLTGWRVVCLMTISTAAWAVWDSHRIELRRYRPGEAAHPVALFWALANLWPLFFPWFLLVRRQVLLGKVPRGPAFHENDVLY